MQELIAGSTSDKQIQENLSRSDFGIGAFSQQFLQSDYILNKEIPHSLSIDWVASLAVLSSKFSSSYCQFFKG
jgi:hypothetical protein